MKFLIAFIIVCICCVESCEIIKYEHNHGQLINYYQKKSDNSTCNNESVYKMLQQPYFIYKSNTGDWCDSYIENETVNCNSSCKEVRFKLNLNSTSRVIPETYDHRFRVWFRKNSMSITCVDSNTLYSTLSNVSQNINQSTSSNDNTTTPNNLKVNTTARLVPKRFELSRNLNGNGNDKKATLNNRRVSIVRDRPKIISSRLKQPVVLKTPNESSENTTGPLNTTISRLIDRPIKPCSLIQLKIVDGTRMGYKLNFTLLNSNISNCMGTPVYRSAFGSYIYRNIFGEWCHDQIDQFKSESNCMRPCLHRRLLPSGIRYPYEAKAVEMYNKPYGKNLIHNYKYTCLSDGCERMGCPVDDTCVLSLITGLYECISGRTTVPDLIVARGGGGAVDACGSMCVNNSQCNIDNMGKPYCACPIGTSGPNCEEEVKSDNICLLKNPCLNGGTCSPKPDLMFTCKCTPEYDGLLCERLSMKLCKKLMNRGRIFAHPKDRQSFVSCLSNGEYMLQKCPLGLVFDETKQICDYFV